MFSRRIPLTPCQKIKAAFWPAMGFYRLAHYYIHRMGRMKETPAAVASGFASGFAISFTPFLGFHMMLGGVMTWMLRGSFIAMVLGSVVSGNFWTYPFIFVGIYRLGKILMGEQPDMHKAQHIHFKWDALLHSPMDYLVPMMLGSLPIAAIAWAASFYVVKRVVAGYKDARLKKIAKK